ncbi:MAG TPA: YidB family protein [Hyphomicrobium sp.]|nr:YidB family protein [Hyphomicrobium sp.]
MTWSDALKGVVGNLVGQAEQAALPDLIKSVLGNEGLQTILTKLQSAGFGAQVQSWFDKNKDSLPITPEQLKTALGDEHVQQIAKSLGIPVDAILATLAEKLPQIADAAGPAANPSAPANASSVPDPKA